MSEILKSKHAFGSEANVDAALASGQIDAYDILFLSEGKIGWIDANGNKVILEDKVQVMMVEALPETGEEGILYVFDSIGYTWNGTEFKPIAETTGLDEAAIDAKIEAANATLLETVKEYTDTQIEEVSAVKIVEF